MSKVTKLACCVTLGIVFLACRACGGQAIPKPVPPSETPFPIDVQVPPTSELAESPTPAAPSETPLPTDTHLPPTSELAESPTPAAPSEMPLPTDTHPPPTSEPTEDTGPVLLITPYVDESDMVKAIGFSIDSNSPWGFAHTGIDFIPNGDLRAFRAVCSGVVDKVELWQLETTLNWQVSARLVCNSRYSVIYAFEPMTSVKSDGETQLANILVVEGQTVAQGDLVGLLPYASPECHVDFGFYDGWDRVCPEIFFTPEAKASILNLLHVGWPDANMCY